MTTPIQYLAWCNVHHSAWVTTDNQSNISMPSASSQSCSFTSYVLQWMRDKQASV